MEPRVRFKWKTITTAVLTAVMLLVPNVAHAGERFDDVDEDHTFVDAIAWLDDAGITDGCRTGPPKEFCPDQPVTRGEMAKFMAKTFDLSAPVLGPLFSDSGDSIFSYAINVVAYHGIASGYGDGSYGPDDPVTRGQMAAFLVRACQLSLQGVPEYFWDDDHSDFNEAINALAHYGITVGRGDALYGPDDPVTRGEMAAFLKRASGVCGDENPQPNPRIPERPAMPEGGTPETNKLLGRILAAQLYGWTGEQFAALDDLIMTESDWLHTAANPRSTAYGIFQFLNGTWEMTEYRKSSDPEVQIRAGLQYVALMYDTPARAWAFKLATLRRDSAYAPSDLRGKAREWIARGLTGY